MFLHYGTAASSAEHVGLWVLGRTLEAVLGPLRFLALYLASGLGGSVAVFLFAARIPRAAGASGAIFGLFAALFIVLKRLGRDTSSVVPILIINIAISFVPGISLAAHLGGLVTGRDRRDGHGVCTTKDPLPGALAAVVVVFVVIALLTVVGTGVLPRFRAIRRG